MLGGHGSLRCEMHFANTGALNQFNHVRWIDATSSCDDATVTGMLHHRLQARCTIQRQRFTARGEHPVQTERDAGFERMEYIPSVIDGAVEGDLTLGGSVKHGAQYALSHGSILR